MKKLEKLTTLLIGILFSANLHAQIVYGLAGTKAGESLNSETIDMIASALPDGEKLSFVIRNDKYETSDGVGFRMLDDDIIDFFLLSEAANNNVEYNYTLDTRGDVSIEDNFYGYEQLFILGANITTIKLGNEEFAKEAGNAQIFENYKQKFEPLISYAISKGFTGDFIFSVAPRPKELGGSSTHSKWNTDLAIFMKESPKYHGDVHVYVNADDAPILTETDHDKIPSVILNGYNQEKDAFFKALAEQSTSADIFSRTVAYFKTTFPNKYMYITEVGLNVATGNLSNTFGHEVSFAKFLNESLQYQDVIKTINRFNGLSKTMTGVISSRNNQDIEDTEYIARLGFYTLFQFMKNKKSEFFINISRTDVGLESERYATFITADNYYSSVGWCEWMQRGSVIEEGIAFVEDDIEYIPSLSYGYFTTAEFEDTIVQETDTVCHTERVLIGERDSLVVIYDTTNYYRSECDECGNPYYYLTHRFRCKFCKIFGQYEEITSSKIDTFKVPIYGEQIVCDTIATDTIVVIGDEVRGSGVEGITDWEWNNPDLVFGIPYNGSNNYSPNKGRVVPSGFPTRSNEDYLLALDGKYNAYINEGIYIIDHCLNVKNIKTIMPYFMSINPEVGYCGVDQIFRNPITGETAKFFDIYTYRDKNGNPAILNINYEIAKLWPDLVVDGNLTLATRTLHAATGVDYSYFNENGSHIVTVLRMSGL